MINLFKRKLKSSGHLVALESKNYGEKWIFSKILTVIQVETWYWGVFCGDKFIGTKIGKFWTVGGAREHKLR